MQRITTKEPDEEQLEVAIKALKLAMPEEFPEEAEAYRKEQEEKAAEKEVEEAKDSQDSERAPDGTDGADNESAIAQEDSGESEN